jgi:hypothetical protein
LHRQPPGTGREGLNVAVGKLVDLAGLQGLTPGKTKAPAEDFKSRPLGADQRHLYRPPVGIKAHPSRDVRGAALQAGQQHVGGC